MGGVKAVRKKSRRKQIFLRDGFPKSGVTYHMWQWQVSGVTWQAEMEKLELASNACVHFFLARVKSVPNFKLLFTENELCCDFAPSRVILIGS